MRGRMEKDHQPPFDDDTSREAYCGVCFTKTRVLHEVEMEQ